MEFGSKRVRTVVTKLVASRHLFPALALAAVLVVPSVSRAECPGQQEQGGLAGFLNSLAHIFSAPDKTKVTFKTKAGRTFSGEVEVEDQACDMTTVKISGSAAIGPAEEGAEEAAKEAGKGEGGKGLSISVDPQLGDRAEIEVTVPNSALKDFPPPNPFDPSSIPKGGTIILKEGWFASLGLEAQYRGLLAEMGTEVGGGNVVAIHRNDDGSIRLMVGPYDEVKNEAFFGIGNEHIALGLSSEQSLQTGTVPEYTFQPNETGDYRLALLRGTLTGTSNTARPHDTVEYGDYSGTLGLEAKLGPVEATNVFKSAKGEWRLVTHPDGSKDWEAEATYDDEQLRMAQKYDAQGNPVGEQELQVQFNHLSDWNAHMLLVAMGQRGVDDDWKNKSPGSLTLDVGENDWQSWRDRARAYLQSHPIAPSPFMEALANANSRFDVAHTLYTFADTYTMTFQELYELAAADDGRVHDPLAGSVSPSCSGPSSGPDRAAAVALAAATATRWCGANVSRTDPSTPTGQPATPVSLSPGAGVPH